MAALSNFDVWRCASHGCVVVTVVGCSKPTCAQLCGGQGGSVQRVGSTKRKGAELVWAETPPEETLFGKLDGAPCWNGSGKVVEMPVEFKVLYLSTLTEPTKGSECADPLDFFDGEDDEDDDFAAGEGQYADYDDDYDANEFIDDSGEW